jgi:hypothetical protein
MPVLQKQRKNQCHFTLLRPEGAGSHWKDAFRLLYLGGFRKFESSRLVFFFISIAFVIMIAFSPV